MSLRKAHLSVGFTLISSRGSVLALLALQCYSSSDSLAASFSLQYPRCIPLAMSFALCGVLCVLPLTVSSHRSYKSPVESGSKASFTASYLSVLAFSATHENMIALNRFLILGLSLFLFIVHALADPELDTVEEQIYKRANRNYQSKYLELPANGVRGVPSFAHLSVVHPVEQERSTWPNRLLLALPHRLVPSFTNEALRLCTSRLEFQQTHCLAVLGDLLLASTGTMGMLFGASMETDPSCSDLTAGVKVLTPLKSSRWPKLYQRPCICIRRE